MACSHLTAPETGVLGAFSIQKESGTWHVYYSHPSKHIKYLVKITRDGDINENQLRMLHVTKR